MSDTDLDRKSKGSDWTERLGRLASLVGLALALIAALGFPSASLQYFRLRIPLQFLGYDRAIRAGILPTIVLILLIVALFCVAYLALGVIPAPWSDISFDDAPLPIRVILYPFVILLSVLGLVIWLALLAAIIAWVAFPFVWLARSFGLWIMFTVLAVVLGANLLFQRRMFRKNGPIRRDRSAHMASRATAQTSRENAGPDIDMDQPGKHDNSVFGDGMPFAGLYAGLAFGAWFIGALFTLRWASQAWFNLKVLNFLSGIVILATGAAFAVVLFVAFFTSFSVPAFSSRDRRKRFLARAELAVTVF